MRWSLTRLQTAVALYLVFVVVLVLVRPALLFDAENRAKQWGARFTDRVSLFAPAFAFPFLGLVSYYAATALELAFGA